MIVAHEHDRNPIAAQPAPILVAIGQGLEAKGRRDQSLVRCISPV
jgi:hypothetical protein